MRRTFLNGMYGFAVGKQLVSKARRTVDKKTGRGTQERGVVGACDRVLRRTVRAHPYSFSARRAVRANHTRAAPSSSATNVRTYGTHDQSPENVSLVSVCRARSPDIPRKTTPNPSSSEPRIPKPT